MKRIVILSDMHCGHRTGLTPPSAQPMPPAGAKHHVLKQVAQRKELWDWFIQTIKPYRPIHHLIHNGDAIDGKGKRSGGTEQLTTDRYEQVEMAADVLRQIGAKQIWMTYGTGYHVGDEEDWEALVAEKVGAEKIEDEGHYDVEGLQIVCKHHIGNSSSPVSRVTAMSSAQIRNALWALQGQQPLANLIVRSHVHRCYNIGFPAINFQGWVTPGLQGLGSKYGARRCDGLPIDFGFLIVEIRSAKDWHVIPEVAPLTMQSAQVNEL